MTDIVERLRVSAANEGTMLLWDKIRGMIARGDDGSRPRDIFETILSALDEERSEAAAEIERLRLSISEAHATGRREGMEEAAKWHDAECLRLREQIKENLRYMSTHGLRGSAANDSCREEIITHKLSASAIRAAMEKKE